jgi:hypothetical protein
MIFYNGLCIRIIPILVVLKSGIPAIKFRHITNQLLISAQKVVNEFISLALHSNNQNPGEKIPK